MKKTHLRPYLERKRHGAKRLREHEPVVPLRRLREDGELARRGPVELAPVDDDAADARAVPADPLGRAVDWKRKMLVRQKTEGKRERTNDIRAVVKGADHVACHAECVIDDKRDLVLVCDLGICQFRLDKGFG
jgi:hypothetical protein